MPLPTSWRSPIAASRSRRLAEKTSSTGHTCAVAATRMCASVGCAHQSAGSQCQRAGVRGMAHARKARWPGVRTRCPVRSACEHLKVCKCSSSSGSPSSSFMASWERVVARRPKLNSPKRACMMGTPLMGEDTSESETTAKRSFVYLWHGTSSRSLRGQCTQKPVTRRCMDRGVSTRLASVGRWHERTSQSRRPNHAAEPRQHSSGAWDRQ